MTDALAITLSSATADISQIRSFEVIDYDTYPAAGTLSAMGFGGPPASQDTAADASLVPSWGGALWLVADALGVELDRISVSTESFPCPEDLTTRGGLHVPRGTVAALSWSLTGYVGDRPLIVSQHVSRVRDDMAPDWQQIGDRGGYRIEIDGVPPLRVEMPLGLAGGTGTCLGDALLMTAARCVNSVSAVVAAPAGYHLLNDLPVIGARHGVRTAEPRS